MIQFIHVNAYAQKISVKTKERKEGDDKPRSVQDIINETLRVEGYYSPTITNPQPPIHLYGEPVEQMPEIVADWAKQTKDPKGRKTRADAKGLLAGVFSVKAGTPTEVWEQVKADGIAWAKLKYGERLKCVVEHIDEEHPHCHFFVVPLPGDKFETVHEGIAAKKAAMSEGVPTKQANIEYRKALRYSMFACFVGTPSLIAAFFAAMPSCTVSNLSPGKGTTKKWQCGCSSSICSTTHLSLSPYLSFAQAMPSALTCSQTSVGVPALTEKTPASSPFASALVFLPFGSFVCFAQSATISGICSTGSP